MKPSNKDRTVSSLVTDLTPELALFSRIVSLYDIDIVQREERERREGIVSTLVTVLKGPVGRRVSKILSDYGCATSLELQYTIPTTRLSAHRIMKRLMSCDVVEISGHVGTPYRPRGSPGPPIPIYGLVGAIPEAVVNAQKRYGEVLKSLSKPESIRQCQLTEALAFCRTYLDDRHLKRVPDSQILTPLLQDSGIRVNYDHLLTALVKEGYRP